MLKPSSGWLVLVIGRVRKLSGGVEEFGGILSGLMHLRLLMGRWNGCMI